MGSVSEVSIFMAFSAGFLTFLSPCVLPLFPSYITYITGRSFDGLKKEDPSVNIRKLTILHSLFFIIGFSIVFTSLGISISYLGSFFGLKKIWLERIGGLLIILFGLNISGLLNIRFFNREKAFIPLKKKIGYIGSSLAGMAFAISWVPCAGPILSSILIYASTLDSLMYAAMLLMVYSLGLAVPFLIAGLAMNQFLFIFNRFKAFMRFVPIFSGVFLVLIGLRMLLGRF